MTERMSHMARKKKREKGNWRKEKWVEKYEEKTEKRRMSAVGGGEGGGIEKQEDVVAGFGVFPRKLVLRLLLVRQS
jgi:hypothetical protein